MKNIFKWAFVALALVGVSCSKSDDNNGGNGSGSGSGSGFNSGDFTVGKHFPRKIIITDDKIRHEEIYEISNGKVVKEDNFIYEYDGNLLKKIKYNDDGTAQHEFSYSNGRLIKHYFRDEGTFEYAYDNQGRLSKKTRTLNGRQTTTEYRYIDDNTIQSTYEGRNITTYTFSNGNLVREEGREGTVIYEYDNKNNWQYKNNLVITTSSAFRDPFDAIFSKNNVVKITARGSQGEVRPGELSYENTTVTFQYEYNSDGYPTKVTKSKNGEVQKVTEYQY